MTYRKFCTPIFTAALCTIAKTRKLPKCPSTKEWIKQLWCIYTTDHYPVVKKSTITPLAATWTDPETASLNDLSQKDKYHVTSLIVSAFFFSDSTQEIDSQT